MRILMKFLLVGTVVFLCLPIILFVCLIDFIEDVAMRCKKGFVDGLSNIDEEIDRWLGV